MKRTLSVALAFFLLLASCTKIITQHEPPPEIDGPKLYTYRVLEEYPHDESAFTQGLVYQNHFFYEGTGMWGISNIRKVDPFSGQVVMQRNNPDDYFGEGITIFDGKIYQLTWLSKMGIIYSLANFDSLGSFTYPTEGWGLTHDGEYLIMSDGSNILRFLDPVTFLEVKRIIVTDNGTPVYRLNELEYIKGKIFANIWFSDEIVIIDPASGDITGIIDLTGILPDSDRTPQTDVLNGIAWDEAEDRIFVTGKRWSRLYEIELVVKNTEIK